MDKIWVSRLQVHSFEVGLACTTRTNRRDLAKKKKEKKENGKKRKNRMGKLQIKMEVNGVTQLNNGPYAKTQRKNISFTSNKVIKRYNRFNL